MPAYVAHVILARMRRACFLAALAAGCEDPGQLESPTLVTLTDVGGVVTVTTPVYTMSFSATGVRMPDRLIVEGQEMFGVDRDVCARESRAGIAVFPAVVAAAGMQGTATRSGLVHPLDGPIVAKVAVDYEVDYSCSDTRQTLKGTSLFTFFPTGRITRFDQMVEPSTTPLELSPQCGCQDSASPNNYFFTSYWAFTPTGATMVDEFGVEHGQGDVVRGLACTIYPDRALGVIFDESTSRLAPNDAAAHVHDFVGGEPSLSNEAKFLGSTVQIVTQDGLGPPDCGSLLGQAVFSALNIGNDLLPNPGVDGIYTSPTPHPTTFEVRLPSGGTTLPAGFAIAVDLGGAEHAVLTRDPAPAAGNPVAFTQRDENGRFVFVFPEALDETQKITIEPRR